MTPSFYNSQLLVFVRQGNAEGMRDYLSTLRNTNFRMASTVLADAALWKGCQDFWHFAAVLVAANNRAYLGTMLKAAAVISAPLPTPEFAASCTTDIDRKKVLESLLTTVRQPADVNQLIHDFPINAPGVTEGILFRVGTSVCYFVLFNLLKQYEDRPDYLRRYGIELIRKGDKRSFNLACVIKEYFGLAELPGTFSLSLQPYELSRLDTSYDTFLTILTK